MFFAFTIAAIVAGATLSMLYFGALNTRTKHEHFIRTYVFPRRLFDELRTQYPGLDEDAQILITRALRMFFLAHLSAGEQVIGMPSKAADALWHEFILDTKAYTQFCQAAFGGYFHHIPATSMQKGISTHVALQRTWRLACLEENINPEVATRLPLLFTLDAKTAFPYGKTLSLEGKHKKEAHSPSCGGSGGCADGSYFGDGCGGGCSG